MRRLLLLSLLAPMSAFPCGYTFKVIQCEDGRWAPGGRTCKVQVKALAKQGWVVMERAERRGLDSTLWTLKLRKTEKGVCVSLSKSRGRPEP